jgi:lipoyl(octanoyl) transferase
LSSFPELWHFTDSGFHNGAANMASDVEMVTKVAAGEGVPQLRVYGWHPPAISLGYHQSQDAIDLDKCRENGIDVVVRPTGGRAILHSEELTYAVVLPVTSRYYHQDTMTVYRTISQCLVTALQQLEIGAVFDQASKTPGNYTRQSTSAMCYASSIQFEICHQGRKLVGSAQRRFPGALLQHGSILIGRDHCRLPDFLALSDEERRVSLKRYLNEHTVCLNDVSPVPVTYDQLSRAVRKGFEMCLDIRFAI